MTGPGKASDVYRDEETTVRSMRDPAWTLWAALAAGGAILAVMGLAGSARPAAQGGPAMRLVAHVPDPLIALVLAWGTLALLSALGLLIPRGMRWKRKEDEEYEFSQEPPKVPAWIMIVVWALVLLPFAAIWYMLRHGWAPPGDGNALLSLGRVLSLSPRQPFDPAGTTSPPLWSAAVAALALCASLGSLGLVLWILFGDRLAWRWAGPLPERRTEMLTGAVDDSLDDLAREPDARIAIIKCYRRFEQVLGRARVPRAPWQTPVEFMREALGRLSLPPRAARRLTELFELARFSNEPLGPADRSSAFESLVEIRAGLGREEASGPSA